MSTERPEWLNRLVGERDSLKSKLDKLETFIDSDNFWSVSGGIDMTYTFRIIAATILVGILAACVSAAGPPLPPEVSALSPDRFEVWAQRHNDNEYALAAQRATKGTTIGVQRHSSVQTDSGTVVQSSCCSARAVVVPSSVRTRSDVATFREYNISPYGGGPVWIINPYCPPK